MRYQQVFAIAILIIFASSSYSADEKTPAEKELDRIQAAIPKIMGNGGHPTIGKTEEKPKDKSPFQSTWSRIRVARMTSPDTAKITINVYSDGIYKDEPPEIYCGTLSLSLQWYRGAWTVTKHEASGWFKGPVGEHGLDLQVIAEIDAIGEQKASPKP